jgi:hypothetical protein
MPKEVPPMTDYSTQLANAIDAMTKRDAAPTLALSSPAKRTLRDILDFGYEDVTPVVMSDGDAILRAIAAE